MLQSHHTTIVPPLSTKRQFKSVKVLPPSPVGIERLDGGYLDYRRDRIPWEEPSISLSLSMGIAIFPTDGEKLDDLFSQADAAMYEAKSAAGGTVSVSSAPR